MGEIKPGFWKFMWEKAGYGRFGERRGWQGRLADYMETYCGFWQEDRPKANYGSDSLIDSGQGATNFPASDDGPTPSRRWPGDFPTPTNMAGTPSPTPAGLRKAPANDSMHRLCAAMTPDWQPCNKIAGFKQLGSGIPLCGFHRTVIVKAGGKVRSINSARLTAQEGG